jgi:hypothetical protein
MTDSTACEESTITVGRHDLKASDCRDIPANVDPKHFVASFGETLDDHRHGAARSTMRAQEVEHRLAMEPSQLLTTQA